MTQTAATGTPAERESASPVRLLLVEGPRLRAEVMRSCLAAEPGIEVVGEEGGEAAGGEGGGFGIGASRLAAVDVVVVDAACDPEAACAAVRELGDRMPGLDVVAIGLEDAAEVVRFVEAGARGYLLRGARLNELVETVKEVHAGRTPCEPTVAAQVLERLAHLAAESGCGPPAAQTSLSAREVEVLEMVADGLSNKEIAAGLGLALSTVKNHVHNLLGKLDVGRRRDAVRVAYQQGLIDRYLPLRTSASAGAKRRRSRSS